MKKIIVLLFNVALLVGALNVYGCGPYKTTFVPYLSQTPILYQPYIQGKVGVLSPYYGIRHLILAYYHLAEKPLDPTIIKIYQQSIKTRPEMEACYPIEANVSQSGYGLWGEALTRYAQVLHLDVEEVFKQYAYGLSSLQEDALRYAAKILNDKIENKQDLVEIQNWLSNQRRVWDKAETLPNLGEKSDSVSVQNDCAYQHAAALFYRDRYVEAANEFFNIFQNLNSPYADLAGYLYVRCYYHQDLTDKKDNATQSFLKSHEAIDKILPTLKNRSNLYTEEVLKLSKHLLALEDSTKYFENLSEKLDLHSQLVTYADWQDFIYLSKAYKTPEIIKQNLASWIFTINSKTKPHDSGEMAWQRWKDTRQKHWLVAAAMLANEQSSFIKDLLADIANINKEYAGYETLAYHQIRLLKSTGQPKVAWTLLEKEMQDKSITLIFRNYLSDLAYDISPDIKSLLPFISQQAVARYDYALEPLQEKVCQPYWFEPQYRPVESTHILNHKATSTLQYLPIAVLFEYFSNNHLPKHVAEPIAIAAWTRALFINDQALAKKTGDWLSHLNTQYQATITEASKSNIKQFAYFAMLTILRNPALTININVDRRSNMRPDILDKSGLQENWWFNSDEEMAAKTQKFIADISWLSEKQKSEALHEGSLLNVKLVDSACNIIQAHIKHYPNDVTIPEAIHYMIEATRRTGYASKASVELFKLLHSKYKHSPWAAKTPYHYYHS